MSDTKFKFGTAAHCSYLAADTKRQIDFFRPSLRHDGGFATLDYAGLQLPYQQQELHTTTRLVHSYALAKQWGEANCDAIIDAGMSAIWRWHRDQQHGGYYWSIQNDRVIDTVKLAYGHVFVLLAAASALQVKHPDAKRLLLDIDQIIDQYFWDETVGRLRDEFNRDWSPFSNYRGMNANMHGIEAFLASYEATGEQKYLLRAGRILTFFVSKIAPDYNWRIPEHYDADWKVDPEYEGDPMFRPRGTTPGHSFELARLLLQYQELTGHIDAIAIDQARNLIYSALRDAWDQNGGLIYTLQLNGQPSGQLKRQPNGQMDEQRSMVDRSNRYWWPVTEAIAALATLIKIQPQETDKDWYRRIWQFADCHLIDHKLGGWYPELATENKPIARQFNGKPDIYHSIQATIIPRWQHIAGIFSANPAAVARS